ncbi:MAG: nucleoside deaminase [Mariprofundales bacterium]
MSHNGTLALTLPSWVNGWVATHAVPTLADDAQRMAWVIALAQQQVVRASGGPFAAAVFDDDSGALVSVGVNVVEASCCALAHAEMVAIGLAQQRLGSFNLAVSVHPHCVLYSSSEPCAMCYGAVPWSGIVRLVCGADAADAVAIGFDEGSKPMDWVAALMQRGISVARGCCRDQAVAVLQQYAEQRGTIYNGGCATK